MFALVAGGLTALLDWGLQALGLPPVATLDEPTLPLLVLPTLLGSSAATLVCGVWLATPIGWRDPRRGAHLLLGFGLGFIALLVACGVPALAGVTQLTLAPHGPLLAVGGRQLVAFALVALGEELAVRGVVLRALTRGLGGPAAVGFTSAAFGLLHLLNPSSSWSAVACITLVGAWFGTLTLRTGSLWCAVGAHWAWNVCEGFVFGQPVSGLLADTALFEAHWPAQGGFWSGASFGPEAAGWTAVLLLAATILTLASRKAPR